MSTQGRKPNAPAAERRALAYGWRAVLALTKIQADELVTDREEHGRHNCPRRHIAPAQMHVCARRGSGNRVGDDRTPPTRREGLGDERASVIRTVSRRRWRSR